ncbi:KH domain-containing, RNA-binding, signal transduction-associated protein 2 isoform X1 [Pseudophryne corroboree]|uniref:KH domain-containing, RNA-binding, signal transduction-associated protein 2 isoform X1 n=1 Tax=Pseudophryne corroboree TaxID=495146 RepID=UPI0030817662
MEQEKYLPELMAEKDTLDTSFVHAMRLLAEEIEKFHESAGKKEDEEKKYLDIIGNKNIKLSEKVLIPVKQYPKFNFVGKLLGPRGNSLKRLQEETGAKMSILGKGSMRDKTKEEELRNGGEAKYAHLSDDLHVLIEVFAPPGEAYSRMSHALEEIKKFLVPDYNDEIRQEQLRELSYLNGSEESSQGKVTRGRGLRIVPATTARSRGGVIPPPLPGRGTPVPRGSPVSRGAVPLPPATRGIPAARARGAPTVSGYRASPPTLEPYDDYHSLGNLWRRVVYSEHLPRWTLKKPFICGPYFIWVVMMMDLEMILMTRIMRIMKTATQCNHRVYQNIMTMDMGQMRKTITIMF